MLAIYIYVCVFVRVIRDGKNISQKVFKKHFKEILKYGVWQNTTISFC